MAELQMKEEKERLEFLRRLAEEGEKKPAERIVETRLTPPPLPPQEIIRPVKEKPSPFAKFFTRFLAFVLIISLAGGIGFSIYWYLFIRKPPPPPPTIILKFCELENKDIPAEEWTKERCESPPPIAIPPPLIKYDLVSDIEISEREEIPLRLLDFLEKDLEKNKIYWLVIKDTQKKEVPNLETFFNVFQAKTPEQFFELLNPEFTLFLYNQEQGKRLGIVAKIKEGQQENLFIKMLLWGETMEKDLNQLFELAGKVAPALKESFGKTNYRGYDIRCQTFTEKDFGSCYAIIQDKFIFSLSLESIKKAIDNIRQ